jgi:hypothetical protein
VGDDREEALVHRVDGKAKGFEGDRTEEGRTSGGTGDEDAGQASIAADGLD